MRSHMPEVSGEYNSFLFPGQPLIRWEATIIPNYLTMVQLHWKDSYLGLAAAPFLASGFGIFAERAMLP